MIAASRLLLCGIVFASVRLLVAQDAGVTVPKAVDAGSAFSIQTTGSGQATLYIVGPGQVLKHDVQLGQPVSFPPGTLFNAGHYIALLSGTQSSGAFDVVPASKPANLSFFARPSRLQVGVHNGVTGALYVFDTYQNLIVAPQQASFELSSQASAIQKHVVTTHEGAAWTAMDSSAQQGTDKFVARVGDVSSTRIIGQVPGDPCSLKMNARPSGKLVELETDPIKDCSGNAVPDGTIVTFTESYGGERSIVDVPIKRGIARVEMPARPGATIIVASGVALGNQIRVGK